MTPIDKDYLALFNDFPDGLFRIDLAGKYILVNELYAEIFGYTPEEMLAKDFDIWKTWAIEDEIRLLLSEAKKRDIKGIVVRSKSRIDTMGYIELSIGVSRDDNDVITGYEGRARDITLRYEAMNSEVEARRNAEFLVDLMAHDLTNIHHGMQMPLEFILGDSDFPEKYRKPLELSVAQLHYATDLIKNVKRLQRVLDGSNNLSTKNLYKELMDAAATAQRAYPAKVLDFELMFKSDEHWVLADNLLVDLFFNLFHNALKHDREATVRIKVEAKQNADDNLIDIHIIDYGPGVPDVEKKRILQRRMGAKGSGIGLTIVNYLLDKYDGSIRVVDRVPGELQMGSDFIVTLRRGM
ncbi:PAS domain-containing sensor histidine kinase [Candidatus Bathyarchaeota archaeon]|nr:PAS domain-containing sensor histidine kinase [Candidatus Bathyarchaeota archaeon]